MVGDWFAADNALDCSKNSIYLFKSFLEMIMARGEPVKIGSEAKIRNFFLTTRWHQIEILMVPGS